MLKDWILLLYPVLLFLLVFGGARFRGHGSGNGSFLYLEQTRLIQEEGCSVKEKE